MEYQTVSRRYMKYIFECWKQYFKNEHSVQQVTMSIRGCTTPKLDNTTVKYSGLYLKFRILSIFNFLYSISIFIFFSKLHQIFVWNLYKNPRSWHVFAETSNKKLAEKVFRIRATIRDIWQTTFSYLHLVKIWKITVL